MASVETRLQRYRKIVSSLVNERSPLEADWRDLSAFIAPSRARFLTTDNNKGRRNYRNIIDSSGSLALRTLKSGMMAGVTSPARKWFRFTVPDDDLNEYGPVKVWLDDVRDRVLAVFGRSNLYNKLPSLYGDMAVFGTGAMAVLASEKDFLRFYDYPIGSYYLGNDHEGRIRVFARKYELTVRQTVMRFGTTTPSGAPDWSRFSDRVKTAWTNGNEDTAKVQIVHLVTPNDQWDPMRLASKYKQFHSCHFEENTSDVEERYLEDKGFDEFPVIAPRWDVAGEDVYGGESPGWIALGDIKQLQFGEKMSLQAIEKGVKPPLVGSIDMKQQEISMIAGDISWVDESTDRKLRPLHDPTLALDQLENKQQQVRNRIDKAFFADLFLMLDQLERNEITATEILERKQEKLLILGPVLEQLNQDGLDPLVERTYAELNRRGEIPPPPPELEGVDVRPEYESIMAQAQKEQGLGALDRFATFTSKWAIDTQRPDALDKVDSDQMFDEYGLMTGVPARIVRPDDEVKKIRDGRARQQQAAQAADTADRAASAAQKLSATDTSGKNALTDLLRGGQQAGPLGGFSSGMGQQPVPASLDGALA